jgi:hypothetical protein
MKYLNKFENFDGSVTSKDIPWGANRKKFKIGDIVKFSNTVCIISNIRYYVEGYDKRGKLLNFSNSQPIELQTINNGKLIICKY